MYGKPIKNRILAVRFGNESQIKLSNGSQWRSLLENQPQDMTVWLTNFYVDCWADGDEPGVMTRFSLEEIISKGIVVENRCGHDHRDQVLTEF